METKFNVGDKVYGYAIIDGFVIYATINSIEITEEIFGLEKLNLENERRVYKELHVDFNEQGFIDKHTKKATVITYVFKIQDNFIKIPEWLYLHSTQTNEVKPTFPLIFSTKEELEKTYPKLLI